MEILFVGRNPVCGDVALRRGQVKFASAYHLVEMLFQCILDVRVPRRG